MISSLQVLPQDVEQFFLEGERASALFNKSMVVKSISIDPNGEWVLGIYRRKNLAGRNEAGLFYGFGPNCGDISSFPFKMLRFFSVRKECLMVALRQYEELVEKHGLDSKVINERPG